MFTFTVTIRTLQGRLTFSSRATSSLGAYMAATLRNGDTPCGITVTLVPNE